MPGYDGLHKLRHVPECRRCRIVLSAGWLEPNHCERGIADGDWCDDWYEPFNTDMKQAQAENKKGGDE